ncbi:MAG: DUF4197 domain-containing protein [Magnetococcales bacterium]|nr:DUF4197 domain-containing protein [Magnetococcales bacterium]MBF0113404.1 DUF4197 domain-containing protein [Magnetococcales bacterium]
MRQNLNGAVRTGNGYRVLWLAGALVMAWPVLGESGGVGDLLNQVSPLLNQAAPVLGERASSGGGSIAGLSSGEMSGGLKEALGVGVKQAIRTLGRQNGFSGDAEVRIPLPPMLQPLESMLSMGPAKGLRDQFIGTLNQAAEKAVPVTADIFAQAIKDMTIEDASAILRGPDNAATEYFRKSSSQHLLAAIRPIVADSTKASGVTSSYKALMGAVPSGGLNLLSGVTGQDASDLDGYVTSKAVDGLFVKLAGEEKNIRANPAARSSTLLKKVFGADLGR